MTLSKNAKLMSAITLLIVPTIMYGGWALLGVLMHGRVGGSVSGLHLDDTQWALWRAGHAHAGVWTLLSLVLQILLDSAQLPVGLMWVARIGAPAAAVALSAAFFGFAFSVAFIPLLYLGIGLMFVALVTTSIGLLRGIVAAVRYGGLPERETKKPGVRPATDLRPVAAHLSVAAVDLVVVRGIGEHRIVGLGGPALNRPPCSA
jgi:hypothetical protein